LFEAYEAIARMPGIGYRREDITDYPVLFWTVGAYLIIYRAAKRQPLEIMAVSQGARDIAAFLLDGFTENLSVQCCAFCLMADSIEQRQGKFPDHGIAPVVPS